MCYGMEEFSCIVILIVNKFLATYLYVYTRLKQLILFLFSLSKANK